MPDRDSRSSLETTSVAFALAAASTAFQNIAVVVGAALDLLERLDQLTAFALDERLYGRPLGIEAVAVLALVGGGNPDVADEPAHIGCP